MKKILALDIGSKRIGIAITDPFGSYALPVGTYVRKNLKTDLMNLSALIRERNAEEVVCGLPLNFDGSRSAQTEYTEIFIDALRKVLDIPIVTSDERCTTAEAHKTLIEGNKRREERKKYVDALAAAYILEGYLQTIKNKGERQ